MKNSRFIFNNIILYGILFSVNGIIFFFSNDISNIKIYLLMLNIFLFFVFLWINFYFYKDLQVLKKMGQDISLLSNKYYDVSDIKHDFTFKESYIFEKIVKKLLIKNNLLNKDVSDLNEFHNKFLSKEIYYELGLKGLNKMHLGNFKVKNIAIMFIDVVGFTSISEQITPQRALFLLNIYFDGIGEIIMKNNGYIDKYLGDGIMVIFEKNHIEDSLKASIEIQEFIEKFKIGELGKKIQIGIGINYGEVILGTVGTKKRMEATVIGDTINTASRLQDLTRKYQTNIIISESVFEQIKNKSFYNISFLGNETLRGKQKILKIYGVDPYYVI